jgi:hypothetical protein
MTKKKQGCLLLIEFFLTEWLARPGGGLNAPRGASDMQNYRDSVLAPESTRTSRLSLAGSHTNLVQLCIGFSITNYSGG